MKLYVADIRRDPTLQLREGGLDRERVDDMVEAMRDGVKMPPVTVVGDDNLLADGFHRTNAAERVGQLDIEAVRVEGGYADAIAIAIRANTNGSKQLTRDERNAAIKRLLVAGWTQERVAEETMLNRTTVTGIAATMRMRGVNIHPDNANSHTKKIAVLPERSPAHDLADTTLRRIAGGVPVEDQVEFAEAVAEAGLSEPRVREAIKQVKAGRSVAAAVAEATPSGQAMPSTPSDVARDVYQRIDRFLATTIRVDGVERDFWQVLEVLVAHRDELLPPSVNTLADRLSELAVRSDHFATGLRSGRIAEAVR